MCVDLHLHSTASDGRLSPKQLVVEAVKRGLKVIAVTDHDSTDGVDEALEASKRFPSLRVVPGVEINTDIPHGEVHILGLFINYKSEKLQNILSRLRNSRVLRAKNMIAKLASLGIHIDMGRVLQIASGGSIGRPHIAQAMYEAGYTSSIQEAFIRYIGRDGPAYVERERLTPAEAVKLVTDVDGLPVLAHPADIDNVEDLILSLKEAGLAGIEVYYNNYSRETRTWLGSLADKYELIPTGGSDFHGFGDEVETKIGASGVPCESARRLTTLAESKAKERMPK